MRPSDILGRQQRGAALLMAMVIVTLVATIASSMVWQQWRAVQVEAAERARSQAHWVLAGALDWSRLILREDANTKTDGQLVDHLGEPWAVELAEARLSSFLAADKNNTDDGPDAFLSGKIEDATARYNLRHVLSSDGQVDPKELAVLRRLCEYAGVQTAVADLMAKALSKATLAVMSSADAGAMDRLGGSQARAQAPLMPQSWDQVVWLGVDAATVERMRPWVTILPYQASGTKVNINTAPREVIAAVVDGLDLSGAERLVQIRQRNPFDSLGEALKQLGKSSLNLDRLDVASDFFFVRGRLRLDDHVIEQRHLVQRRINGNEVVVRLQESSGSVDPRVTAAVEGRINP